MDSSVLTKNKNGKIYVSIAAMTSLELRNPQFPVLIESITVYEGLWAKTCSPICSLSHKSNIANRPNAISLSNVQMNSIIEVHKFRPLQLGLRLLQNQIMLIYFGYKMEGESYNRRSFLPKTYTFFRVYLPEHYNFKLFRITVNDYLSFLSWKSSFPTNNSFIQSYTSL